MANFAESFAAAIPSGIYLSRELRERGQERAAREALGVLAEFEADDPFDNTYDAAAQGVAEPGQEVAHPNQGGSSSGYLDMRDRYFRAATKTGNLDTFKKATEAWGVARRDKINNYGMAAINAYDRGDMEGSKKMIRAASAYVDPYSRQEISLDPKSGSFLIASYDKAGNPAGGMAWTRDNLVDFVNMNTDPMAWAEQDWNKQIQGAELDQMRKRDAQSANESNWRIHFMKTDEERKAELHAVDGAAKLAELRVKESEMRVAEALEDSNITTQEKLNRVSQLDSDKKEYELLRARADAAKKIFIQHNSALQSDVERNQAAMLADSSNPGPLGAAVINKESGGNWAASNDIVGAGGLVGHWGRGQFSTALLQEAQKANVFDPSMSPREFASDTPKGRAAQIAMETWQVNRINDFIEKYGLAEYEGQRDANGTMITREGMIAAAHINGTTGLLNWLKTGDAGKKDVNGNGAGEYMALVLQPGAGGAPAGTAPQPGAPPGETGTDILSATVEAEKDKDKEADRTVLHPYLMDAPDENGFSSGGLRPGIDTLATELGMNLSKNNPDMTEEDIAHVLDKTLGPNQTSVIEPVEGDDNQATISDGLHKYKLDNTRDIVGNLFQFREDEKELLASMAPYDEQYVPQEPGPAAIPLPESRTPNFQPPGSLPSVAPAPPAATDSMGVATGVPAGPPAVAGAIPEASWGYDTAQAATPPAVDDTAVATPPQPQQTGGPLIPRIATLTPLVEAWKFRGAPPRGPELAAILQVVETMPIESKQQIMAELQQISLEVRRSVRTQEIFPRQGAQ